MALQFVNAAWMLTATTGVGTVTVSSAKPGYFTFAEAGLVNANTARYKIIDGNDFEIGIGTYTSAGTTFSRDTVLASKIGGVAGTSKINLSGSAEIFLTEAAGDTARLGITNTFLDGNILAAGTVSLAPLKLQAGTNLTTAEDGAIEMDANNMYGTVDAGNRGIIPLRHFIRLTSARTFTSNTSEQAIFNAPANGALTLEIGAYRFKCLLSLSAMSATSGNAAFDFLGAGTAVVSEILYLVVGSDAALAGFGTSSGGVHAVQQTGVSMVAANTNTALQAMIEGVFNVTTGGTVIPSITLATAAAAVAAIGSFFECERIGGTTVQSVGQWS